MEQPEQKKHWWQNIADRFKHPTEKEAQEYKLSDQGIKIAKDTRLDERIAAMKDLQTMIFSPITATKPEQYLEELKNRLDTMNLIITLTAAPYARSGDYPQYRRMMRGWSAWYAIASSWMQRTQDYFLKAESNPIDYGTMDVDSFLRMLHDVLQKHVFKDAFTVLNCCFRDKDVSEKAVAVINTFQPYGNQADMGKIFRDE